MGAGVEGAEGAGEGEAGRHRGLLRSGAARGGRGGSRDDRLGARVEGTMAQAAGKPKGAAASVSTCGVAPGIAEP